MAANEIRKVAAITIVRKRLLRIVNPPFSNIVVNENEIDAEHQSASIKRFRARMPGTFLP
jgi:hypothetical protein